MFWLLHYTETHTWFEGKAREYLGNDISQYELDRLWFTSSTVLNHVFVFYFLNFLIALCYKFDLFAAYRVRPKDQFPPMKLVWTCFLESLVGTLVAAPLGVYYLLWPLICTKLQKNADGVEERIVVMDMTTTVWEQPVMLTLAQLAVSFIAEDTMFYWMHRLLHHKLIYKHIHKKHHQFKYTIGLAAEYAHPVEIVLGNVIPTHMGCLLMGMPLSVLLLWTTLRVWEAIDGHSGYAFPLSPWNALLSIQGGTERHDFHHSHNVGSFGSFTKFWDWVTGTDKPFKKWQQEQKLEAQKAKEKALATDRRKKE